MDWLFLIESRLAAGLVQVVVGIGLLGWWAYRRDRRTARREQALKFIEETADRLNTALSCGFGLIHQQNLSALDEFAERIGVLFERRLGTRIKSQAFLGSGDFAREYERVMFQLDKCLKALKLWEQSRDVGPTLERVRTAVPEQDHEDLKIWGEATGPAALRRPWGYFETWMGWLWSLSDEMLAKSLESTLKGKRRFKLPFNPSLQRRPAASTWRR